MTTIIPDTQTAQNTIPDAGRIAATIAAIAQSAGIRTEVDFHINYFGEAGALPTVTISAAQWVAYADREELLRRVAAAVDPGALVRLSCHHGRRWISSDVDRDGVRYQITSPLSGSES